MKNIAILLLLSVMSVSAQTKYDKTMASIEATYETGDYKKTLSALEKFKKKSFKKRGEKRIVHHGFVHIQASFNNTLVTITDAEGAVVSWSSAGAIGFKGSR